MSSGGCFSIKMLFNEYRKFCCGDNMVITILPEYEISFWRWNNLITFLSPSWDFLCLYDDIFIWKLYPGGRLNKKDGLTSYGDSHVKDKTS